MNKTIDEQPGLHDVIGAIERRCSFDGVSDFALRKLVSWLHGPEETDSNQKAWIAYMKKELGFTDEDRVASRVKGLRASDNYATATSFLGECYAKIKQERGITK